MDHVRNDEWIHRLSDRQQLAVGRVINAPVLVVMSRTPRARGPIEIEGIWARDETGPCGRPELARVRVPARLRAGRRTWSVELELAPWSEHATELLLRPVERRAYQWGLRRRSYWYAAAHPAIDELRSRIAGSVLATSDQYRPARESATSDCRWSA
jgi:hypothetical protein